MNFKGIFGVILFFLTPGAVNAATLGNWVARTSGVAEQLWSIADGSPRMVAVGNGGAIVGSSDGITWTTMNSGVTTPLRAVAYGQGIYVAAGTNGMTLRSLDGQTWTANIVSPSVGWWAATHTGGKFVMVGSGGTIATSTDGLNWTLKSAPGVTDMLFGVEPGNYVVGANGAILNSIDGENWALQFRDPSGRAFSAVSHGALGYVAAGDNGTTDRSVLYSSSDGSNWVTRNSTTTFDLNGVAFGLDVYLAVSDNGVYLTSTNLTAWKYATQSGVPTLRSVIYARGSFFAVGANGYIGVRNYADPSGFYFDEEPVSQVAAAGTVVTFRSHAVSASSVSYQWFKNDVSIPGQSSSNLTFTVSDPGDNGLYKVRATSDGSVLFSRSGELTVLTRPNVIITSPAAGATLPAENPVSMTASVTSDLVITNLTFFLGTTPLGSDTTAPYEVSALLAEGNYVFTAVAYNNRGLSGTSAPVAFKLQQGRPKITTQPPSQHVVAGRQVEFTVVAASIGSPTYQWKKDGTNLVGATAATLPVVAAPGTAGGYSVVVSNPAGSVESTVASLVVEPARIDWTTQFWHPEPTRPVEAFTGLAFGHGTFVAVGARGFMVASSDGSTWTDITTGFTANISTVRFLEGRFWATCDDGGLLVSTNGDVWDRIASGVTTKLTDITYYNGVFIAVGNAGRIVRSLDGTNWSALPALSGNPNLLAVTSANALFVAVTATSGESYVSTIGSAWEKAVVSSGITATTLAHFRGQFIVVLANGVYISADGKAWTRKMTTSYTTTIASPFKLLLFAPDGATARTENGVDFTAETSTFQANPAGVAYDGTLYYMVGNDAYGGYIAASLNGLAWSKIKNTPLLPPSNSWTQTPRLSFAGGNFYFAGGSGAVVPMSTGANGWTNRAKFSFVNGHFGEVMISGVQLNNGQFHASTAYVSYSQERSWASEDGIHFVVKPGGWTTVSLLTAAEGELLQIASRVAARSTDGVNWRGDNLPVTVFGAGRGNGVSLVVGLNGAIFRAPAGGDFAQIPSGTTQLLEGVAYGQGRFVVVGKAVLYSLDHGLTWLPARKDFGTELTSVTYANDLFMATGNGGTLAYSWDGITWEISQLHTGPDLFSAAYGNGRWVVAGRGGTLLQTGPRSVPTAPSLSFTVAANQMTISIEGEAGTAVRLESTSDLSTASWQVVARFVLGSSGAQKDVPITSSAAEYFRVVTE